ncbi:MAG: choice-of-anchor L domain-containing protein [Flavobacteriales bacterium]|nr:choice-of-anchor L domain-containing protein [Flavobacteriales bacterium]
MINLRLHKLLTLILVHLSILSNAQLNVLNTPQNTNGSPVWLIENVLLGNGVTATNISFQGDSNVQVGFFDQNNSNIPLSSGIIMTTGNIGLAPGSPGNFQPNAGLDLASGAGDPDLQSLVGGASTNDAIILEFDFVPLGDSVSFNYVFASEEYPEWVCSNFNDVFGFFISGPGINGSFSNGAANIALIPGTSTPVAINSVNPGVSGNNGQDLNCDNLDPNWPNYNIYYNDNVGAGGNAIEYDGFTTVLTAFRTGLQCGQVYHIKLAIADVFDGTFDSAVFLEQGSFTAPGIKVEVKTVTGDETMIEGCAEANFIFIRPDTIGFDSVSFDIAGNAINGVDYSFLSNTVIFQPGEDSVTVTISPIADGVAEGTDTVIVTVMNITQCGDTVFETAELFIVDGYNLPISANNVSITCPNDTVTISANASGGTPPYDYVWSNGDNNQSTDVSPFATDTFFVTATDFPGCPGIDTVIVTVLNPNPPIFAGVDTGFCLGDSIQLLATGGVSYLWSPPSGLSSTNIPNPFAFGGGINTYFVTGTDVNGCQNIDTIVVTGDSIPFIQVRTDTAICLNDSIQLGGNPSGPGNATFSWSPTGSLNDASSDNPWATPNISTQYILTVISAGNCATTDTVDITVLTLPVVTSSNDTQICSGDTIPLFASGGLNYLWSPGISLSSNNISTPDAFPSDTTNYIVSVTDANNCTSTDTVLVIVNPLPAAEAGQNSWLCPGSNFQLNASGGQTYAWFPNQFLTDSSINNPVATPPDTIVYYVIVTDSNNCVNIDSIQLDVGNVVPVNAGNDTGVCIQDTIALGGSPTAPPGSDYAWAPNIFINDTTLANPLVSPNIAIQYTVFVTNDTCSGADTINLVVYNLPNVDAFGDTSICLNDSTLLVATGGIGFSWSPVNGLSSPNDDSTYASPDSTTMYFVEITDTNNCSVTDSVEVEIFNLPIPISSNDTTICIGDTIQLTSSGGQSYLWSPNISILNQTNDTALAFPQDTVIYMVLVTDSNNCSTFDTVAVNVFPRVDVTIFGDTSLCIGDSVSLSASGAISYAWSPGSIILPISADSILAFPTSNDSIYLTTIDTNNCQKTDTILLTVNNLPVITLQDSLFLCLFDTATIPVSGAQNYTWNPSGSLQMTGNDSVSFFTTDTSFIQLAATDVNGCISFDSIFVLTYPLPELGLSSDTSTCAQDSVNVTAAGTGTFLWTPITGISNPGSASVTIAPPIDSMVYSVQLTDSNNCVNNQSTTIYTFGISISSDTAICDAERFQFATTVIGGNEPIRYTWMPSENLSDPLVAEPFVNIANNTLFTLIAIDTTGCADTAISTLDVKSNPLANFDMDILPSCEGVLVKLDNSSLNALSATWYINDDDSSFVDNIERVFEYGDSVNVRLLVVNAENCVDDTITNLNLNTFKEYMDFDLANVFTPNFDGQNEWFELNIANDLQDCSELRIFNRWGQLMFISQGNNHSWNGRSFDGQEAPEGVYFYTLEVSELDFSGYIQLIR